MKHILAALVLFVACAAPFGFAAEQLEKGDYVAVIGDSITEQRKYSVYIEDYLVMCQSAPELRQTQFGWSGETSWGFERRMQNDMIRFKATAATTCFGMNDGGYSPMNEDKAQRYRAAQTKIVEQMKQTGVRFIVVGSPGCVDVQTFRNHNREAAEMYNKTLAALRDIAKDVAEKQGVAFADVFDPMHDVMEKGEEKYGKNYHVAGPDGVHPDNKAISSWLMLFSKGWDAKGTLGRSLLICRQARRRRARGTRSCRVVTGRSRLKAVGIHSVSLAIRAGRTPPAACWNFFRSTRT